MLSEAAADLDTVAATADGRAATLSIEIATALDEVESAWRALEARGTGSPYQRFDWVRSFVETKAQPGLIARIVVIRDAAGRPAMLLPLGIRRAGPFRVASMIGGKHANFQLPLACPRLSASIGAAEHRHLLTRIGQRLGVDALDIQYVPRTWHGETVPLAAGGHPSPSDAYGLTLDPDGEATVRRAMSSEGRRKLRNKENTIRKLGELAFLVAREPAEAELILDAFFRQKSERFRAQGIQDPFAGAAEAFIREASLRRLAEGRPAIELSALTLDGRVIAAFGGAVDRRRISGMFISFDPDLSRYSPGDQLVARVVADSAARGRAFFDLGVGEAEYKRRFCREVEELVDVLLPVSARGRLYVAARLGAIDAKRRLKRSERVMTFVRGLRRARARLGI